MINLNKELENISNEFDKQKKIAHSKFDDLLYRMKIENLVVDACYEFDKREVWCNLIIRKINDTEVELGNYHLEDEINLNHVIEIFKEISKKQDLNLKNVDLSSKEGFEDYLASEFTMAELSFELKRSPIELMNFLSNIVNSDISFIPSKYINHTS